MDEGAVLMKGTLLSLSLLPQPLPAAGGDTPQQRGVEYLVLSETKKIRVH